MFSDNVGTALVNCTIYINLVGSLTSVPYILLFQPRKKMYAMTQVKDAAMM